MRAVRLAGVLGLLAPAALCAQPTAADLPCDTVRHEVFRSITRGWSLSADSRPQATAELVPGGGIRLTLLEGHNSYRDALAEQLARDENFVFDMEATVSRGGAGLIFGFIKQKKHDGLFLQNGSSEVVVRHYSPAGYQEVRKNAAGAETTGRHRFQVARVGSRLYYSIDGQLVDSSDYFAGPATESYYLGFQLVGAGSELTVHSLTVRQRSRVRLAPDAPRVVSRQRLAFCTTRPEYVPMVSADGQRLYFSRCMGKAGGKVSETNYDILLAERGSANEWRTPQPLPAPLNTVAHNENVVSVSPDGRSLLVKDHLNKGSEVAQTVQQGDGSWTVPTPFASDDLADQGERANHFLHAGGMVMVTAYGTDKTDVHTSDLYVRLRKPDGSWGKALSLGPVVNTPRCEQAPFLAPDGKTLYFSSYGHPGYGDADIFVTRRLDDTWTNWSEPLNLGRGINTPNYEGYFSLSASGDRAYLVSQEPDAAETDTDIYELTLPAPLRPAPAVLVRGRVLDARTGQPLPAAEVRYETLPSGQEAGLVLESAGAFKIALPVGAQYGFRASATGYFAVNENVDLSSTTQYGEVQRDLLLWPMASPVAPANPRLAALQLPPAASAPPAAAASLPTPAPAASAEEKIILNNVFFEQSKPVLLPASFPELQRLAQTLRDNPTLRLRLEGHTDNGGESKKNLVLSEQRVAAIRTYLVRQRIKADRLTTVGYGDTRPVAPNDTEANRARNRRVEFAVVAR